MKCRNKIIISKDLGCARKLFALHNEKMTVIQPNTELIAVRGSDRCDDKRDELAPERLRTQQHSTHRCQGLFQCAQSLLGI